MNIVGSKGIWVGA